MNPNYIHDEDPIDLEPVNWSGFRIFLESALLFWLVVI